MSHTLLRDRMIACLLAPFIFLILGILYCIVVVLQGRPFLFASERMRDADTSFMLYKIRTMDPPNTNGEESALGGHQRSRVTPIGRFLRRTRLDELPQLYNVIRGDIQFFGPRPPLRRHVAANPGVYRCLLSACRPGITGLATVTVHAREERLLSRCRTAQETEEVYIRRCLSLKLKLDFIYVANRSLALDLLILYRTFARLMPKAATRSSRPAFFSRPPLSFSKRSPEIVGEGLREI